MFCFQEVTCIVNVTFFIHLSLKVTSIKARCTEFDVSEKLLQIIGSYTYMPRQMTGQFT